MTWRTLFDRRWVQVAVVLALLTQMAFAMVTTAREQTPTIDEPVYLGAAAVYLTEHSVRYNPEHPPLGKLVIATGLALAGPQLQPGFRGDQTELGRHLLYEQGNDPGRLMLAARLPMIVVTLLFGLVVLAFARDLAGPVGGLVALGLYAFSPDLIAHGSLATLDVPAAGLLLTATWALWRARRRPLPYLTLAGLALGAALATRMSALPAVPLLLALAVLSLRSSGTGPKVPVPATAELLPDPPAIVGRVPDDPALEHRASSGWGRAALAVAGMAALAVAVVWVSYLAVDPRLRWTAPPDLPAVHGLTGFVVDRLPFPEAYRDGMRVQLGFERDDYGGFLLGRRYTGSLWFYLPAAVLVKTPLGMLALWAAGSLALLVVPRLRTAAPYVLVPPIGLLLVAMTGARDYGVRYVIVLPVFLAVAAATVVTLRARAARPVAAGLVLVAAVSSLSTFPYYLPYSNEAFGGPDQTWRRLHDSNVDWGQDLGRLAERLRTRYPGQRIWLVYKGSGVPAFYGIDARNPRRVPPDEVTGLLVVSNSAAARAGPRLRALLAGAQPIDQVGHSITIYRREAP